MFKTETLQVPGVKIPNTYIRNELKNDHLAILLPGRKYTFEMPLLYYIKKLLLSLGLDVFCLDYTRGHLNEAQASPDTEDFKQLPFHTAMACSTVLSLAKYRKVTLLGKSLGTRLMARLTAGENNFRDSRLVWLTPLVKETEISTQIKKNRQRSLIIAGTGDKHWDPAFMKETGSPGENLILFDDADHGLEYGDDVFRTINTLNMTMDAIRNFLVR